MLQTCRARKILNLRLFADPDSGKAWDKSVTDLGLEVLCVSQVGLFPLTSHPPTLSLQQPSLSFSLPTLHYPSSVICITVMSITPHLNTA